jgi:DNA-binding Lrp family transcriptional regulator
MKEINCEITTTNLETNEFLITGFTSCNTIYYTMNFIAKKLNLSYKTVQRKIREIRENKNVNLIEYFIQIDKKNYVSMKLFEKVKENPTNTNDESQPLIIKAKTKEQRIQEGYVATYKDLEWDFFTSIHFETLKTQKGADSFMRKFSKQLKEVIESDLTSDFQILFTIEKNHDYKGLHLHFLTLVEQKDEKELFLKKMDIELKKYANKLNFNNLEYNPNLKGLEYIFKQSSRKDFEHDLIKSVGL